MKYNFKDIAMTEAYRPETRDPETDEVIEESWGPGDFLLTPPDLDYNYSPIDETVDIATKHGYENLKQILMFRFFTRRGDYVLNPGLGQNLDDLYGRRMSKQLLEDGRTIIINTIVYDRLVSGDDLEVTGIPVDQNTILYAITINNATNQPYKFNLTLDLENDRWTLK